MSLGMLKGIELRGSNACLEGVENALQNWSIPHDSDEDDIDSDGDETANIASGQLQLSWNRHCPTEGVRLLGISGEVHRL